MTDIGTFTVIILIAAAVALWMDWNINLRRK